MSYYLWRLLYSQTKMSDAFSRILHLLWLQEQVPYFIEVDDRPSSSPDLNPLDYKLWSVLEEHAHAQRNKNLNLLKAVIVKAAREIPLAMIHELIVD